VVLYLKIANNLLFPHPSKFLINSPHLSLGLQGNIRLGNYR
jgi:hypothetical protein